MTKKIKKITILIAMLKEQHRVLMIEHEKINGMYMLSNKIIDEIENDIGEYNQTLVDLMTRNTASFMEKYKITSDYVKTLFVNLHTEKENNSNLKSRLDKLESEGVSLKVKSRGYELLVENRKQEIGYSRQCSSYKEIDDLWLLKGLSCE